jgi:hypothetical protein
MGIIEGFGILKELFLNGGLEICTSRPGETPDCGDVNQRLFARTIIQPDGDVITFVDDAVFKQELLWKAHLNKMVEKIRQVRLIRSSPALLVSFVSIISLPASVGSRGLEPIILGAAGALILLTGAIYLLSRRAFRSPGESSFLEKIGSFEHRLLGITWLPDPVLNAADVPIVLLKKTGAYLRRAFQMTDYPEIFLKTICAVTLIAVGLFNAISQILSAPELQTVCGILRVLGDEPIIWAGLIVSVMAFVIRGLLAWLIRRRLGIKSI